jgi:hypothetical protein
LRSNGSLIKDKLLWPHINIKKTSI